MRLVLLAEVVAAKQAYFRAGHLKSRFAIFLRTTSIPVCTKHKNVNCKGKPTAFILTNEEINHLKDEYEKKGKKSLWIHKKKYFDKPGFKENWNRLKDQIYNK